MEQERCTWCGLKGHTAHQCPYDVRTVQKWEKTGLLEGIDKPTKSQSKQLSACRYCSELGHNVRTCQARKDHIADFRIVAKRWRELILQIFHKWGIGEGIVFSMHTGERFILQSIQWKKLLPFSKHVHQALQLIPLNDMGAAETSMAFSVDFLLDVNVEIPFNHIQPPDGWLECQDITLTQLTKQFDETIGIANKYTYSAQVAAFEADYAELHRAYNGDSEH